MKRDFQLHNSFAFWLHRLSSLLQERFNQALKSHDITWPQWMLLNVLYAGQVDTPAMVADQLGVDRSGVTRLLDRLESKEYIYREHDKLDRRSVKLRLTAKGQSLMAEINALAHEHQEGFLQDLHISERRAFKKEVQKLLRTCGIDTQNLWQRFD